MAELEIEIPVININDTLSTRFGNTLTGTFVAGGNKIALSAFRPILGTTRDVPTENAGKDPVYIHLSEDEFIFNDPILRALLAESNSTFIALQSLKRQGSKTEYLKLSRTYRSIIRACLEKLENESDAALIKDDHLLHRKYKEYIRILYTIECIWHLFEVLLLNMSPSNTVVPSMLRWVRFHFPNAERDATDLMLQGREAIESENFWPTLKTLITQGQVDVTRAILQLHPSAESMPFKIVDDILKNVPIYHDGAPMQKFRAARQFWEIETQRKLASDILSVEPQLEELIQLVLGDIDTWTALMNNSTCWYDTLPGFLFFTNPACKYFELGDAANAWINRWSQSRNNELVLDRLDYILLNLMENNMARVLHSIHKLADNHWFATHLIDLLYNAGQLKEICSSGQIEYRQLRQSLLLEFGSCLMSRDSLWQLGMDYIEQCGDEGQAILKILLEKIYIKTEKQALRVIAAARQRGFDELESSLCKVQYKRSLVDKRYGNALEWAIRSKDAICVTAMADFLLKHYANTSEVYCPDVIANIGAKMFISTRLVFLVKYFDFYQFYNKRDFLPAAELLISLLESKLTPDYFWPSLLFDTIPLLESKDPKILSQETFTILHHLETDLLPLIQNIKNVELKNNITRMFVLKGYRVDSIEEIIALLRLACARNLARAMVIENCSLRTTS